MWLNMAPLCETTVRRVLGCPETCSDAPHVASGKCNSTRRPPSASDRSSISFVPCERAIALTIASPNPLPRCSRTRHAVEAVHHPRAIGLRNARATVLDGEHQESPPWRRTDTSTCPPFRRVLDRVVQQVAQQNAQGLGCPVTCASSAALQAQVDVPERGLGIGLGHHLPNAVSQSTPAQAASPRPCPPAGAPAPATAPPDAWHGRCPPAAGPPPDCRVASSRARCSPGPAGATPPAASAVRARHRPQNAAAHRMRCAPDQTTG